MILTRELLGRVLLLALEGEVSDFRKVNVTCLQSSDRGGSGVDASNRFSEDKTLQISIRCAINNRNQRFPHTESIYKVRELTRLC